MKWKCGFSRGNYDHEGIKIFFKMDEFELNKYFCSMFQDFKPVLKILLRFIIIYVVLVLGYQIYLNGLKNQGLCPVSEWVANQVA